MGELSIEEKAKAYDEAIERARKINSGEGVAAPPDWTTCEVIFPELKEIDDDRIKEAIKSLIIASEKKGTIDGVIKEHDALVWLEKQGEQNPKSAEFIPTDCTSDAKYENRWHKVEDSLPDNAREVLCKDAIGNFFIGRYYNDGDYWEVSIYDGPDKSNEYNPPVIMWMNIPSCVQNLANSEKTCKVEPKFKAGDWVIHGSQEGIIYQVEKSFLDGTYRIVPVNDKIGKAITAATEDAIRLWTIQDAKDGDVLSFNDGHGNDSIELIKSITDKKIEFWFCLTNGNRYEVFDGFTPYTNLVSREDATPATKEQCDQLEKAMADAGYRWNPDEKKMEKIAQNPAWSEKDEQYLLVCKNALAKYQTTDKWDAHIIFDWLENKFKSLSSQNTWKPSDKQMASITCAVQKMKESACYDSELVSLLNELKKLKG